MIIEADANSNTVEFKTLPEITYEFIIKKDDQEIYNELIDIKVDNNEHNIAPNQSTLPMYLFEAKHLIIHLSLSY